MVIFYETTFVISLILSVLYVAMWNRHFDVNISMIFLLVPISSMGYLLFAHAQTAEEAVISNKIIYIGGVFLPFFINMCIMNLCEIKVNRFIRMAMMIICSIIYLCVLSIGKYSLYYRSYTFEIEDGERIFHKVYGPAHTAFYIMVGVFFLVGISAIIHSYITKMQVSRMTLMLLFIPEMVSIICFFGNKLLGRNIELLPVSYIFAEIMYILIIRRLSRYSISDNVVESMIQKGDTGFVSLDLNYRYLGSNATAREILPELSILSVDQDITGIKFFEKTILHWIKHFDENGNISRNLYVKKDQSDEDNDKAYVVNVNYLYDGKKKKGYQILLNDDTQNQKYIALIDKYNTELEQEVDEKTQHIVEMHNNLIMGMATMVESRDNSTGGHIKRTSTGVRILIDEIKNIGGIELTEKFCSDIIKAAPMHDIGKIAVDDAILRKPGRFTDEEFAKMKVHAAEGAKIISEILKDTDDDEFKVIAENVAHYHHERWDGSGYPDGLKGEEIPLEARIMAIADVYDALVSKRVYKERMSFEEADRIIMDGMGKHFDEKLKPYYVSARPRFEEYYSELES